MRFHFRANNKPNFENHVFRAVSGPFHPLYEPKISNRSLSVVYGSITLNFFPGLCELVRTSGSTAETKFKKRVFWDTLIDRYQPSPFETIVLDWSLSILQMWSANEGGVNRIMQTSYHRDHT